jgi:hypothetical protein
MGMDHYYVFFDRDTCDPVWSLAWAEFMKMYPTRWTKRRKYSPDDPQGDQSLRGLIACEMEKMPTGQELEDVLKRRTVRWTISRCQSKPLIMYHLILNIPSLRKSMASFHIDFCDSLIAAAVDAFLTKKIRGNQLRAILRLHNAVGDPYQILELTRREKSLLKADVSARFYQRSIYPWLGQYWLDDEWAWTSGLANAETRAFADFIKRAWEENWPCPRLDADWFEYKANYYLTNFNSTGGPSYTPYFRDIWAHKAMFSVVRSRVTHWANPIVFRFYE